MESFSYVFRIFRKQELSFCLFLLIVLMLLLEHVSQETNRPHKTNMKDADQHVQSVFFTALIVLNLRFYVCNFEPVASLCG